MGKPSKAVRELREKYGLNNSAALALSPVQTSISRIHRPARGPDPLQLIVIALRQMAKLTERDDLRPHYIATADDVVELINATRAAVDTTGTGEGR